MDSIPQPFIRDCFLKFFCLFTCIHWNRQNNVTHNNIPRTSWTTFPWPSIPHPDICVMNWRSRKCRPRCARNVVTFLAHRGRHFRDHQFPIPTSLTIWPPLKFHVFPLSVVTLSTPQEKAKGRHNIMMWRVRGKFTFWKLEHITTANNSITDLDVGHTTRREQIKTYCTL